MFLVARSAACIALVVAALPSTAPARRVGPTFDTVAATSGGIATATVGRFCQVDPGRCRRALSSVVAARAVAMPGLPHAERSGSPLASGI